MKKIKFSLYLKLFITIFTSILVPVYTQNYGFSNFLWISDIGLFLTLIGLWLESSLLFSICAIAILPFELLWNIDFFYQIIFNKNLLNIAGYMFDDKYALSLRSLSLFHIFMPLLWIYYLYNYTYNKNAFKFATILIISTFILTYFLTNHADNINWINLPVVNNWPITSLQWLLILIITYPLLVILPMHKIIEYFKN